MTEKVKLTGGPDKTVTWVWLEKGQLRIEFYDFSETAQRMFGNDIAYRITVQDTDKLFSTANQIENSMIGWMEQRFQSYFDIRRWLEEHEIGYSMERESWA